MSGLEVRFVRELRDSEESEISTPIRFIDLFAGIGGFHYAFHSIDRRTECVFVSEWDESARKTYQHNFQSISPRIFEEDVDDQGEKMFPRFAGDITAVDYSTIEDFDVLCAGFPCQPFSNAGKRLGMEEARGTLFFNILEILKQKKPRAFFLENVTGLLNHHSGSQSTFAIIEKNLRELGYSFRPYKVKASDYGVPQLRPRVFMIGFREADDDSRFVEPAKVPLLYTMSDVFGGSVSRDVGYTLRVGGRRSGLMDRRNWDTYLVDGQVRYLGPSEGLKMQGFPESFAFPPGLPETQAMKQLGNSVAVPAVRAFAQAIADAIGGKKQ